MYLHTLLSFIPGCLGETPCCPGTEAKAHHRQNKNEPWMKCWSQTTKPLFIQDVGETGVKQISLQWKCSSQSVNSKEYIF